MKGDVIDRLHNRFYLTDNLRRFKRYPDVSPMFAPMHLRFNRARLLTPEVLSSRINTGRESLRNADTIFLSRIVYNNSTLQNLSKYLETTEIPKIGLPISSDKNFYIFQINRAN